MASNSMALNRRSQDFDDSCMAAHGGLDRKSALGLHEYQLPVVRHAALQCVLKGEVRPVHRAQCRRPYGSLWRESLFSALTTLLRFLLVLPSVRDAIHRLRAKAGVQHSATYPKVVAHL